MPKSLGASIQFLHKPIHQYLLCHELVLQHNLEAHLLGMVKSAPRSTDIGREKSLCFQSSTGSRCDVADGFPSHWLVDLLTSLPAQRHISIIYGIALIIEYDYLSQKPC